MVAPLMGLCCSARMPHRCWHGVLATAVALWLAALGGGLARAETRVLVVGLVFKGDVPSAVRTAMVDRLGNGLSAAGLRLAPESDLRRALGGRQGPCVEVACWKEVAAKLGCRYVVGGAVKGEEQSYEIALWIGDSLTGLVSAWVQERCDICGLRAAAEKMDLTASALVAKLAEAERAPARVTVTSDPPGATVVVDGTEKGPAPRELELAAGRHTIVLRSAGFLTATRSLTAVAGVHERLPVQLVPQATRRTSTMRIIGWVAVGMGVAAVAAGAALLALDGREVDCITAPAGRSCRRRETTAEGATLVGVGVAAAGVGGYLIYRARATERRAERRASLLPVGAGAGLTVKVDF